MCGGTGGNFGNTIGSRLDTLSNLLTAASLIPGLDTFADLASIPVDLARGDFVSAGLGALGAVPFVGEVADTAKLAKMADKAVDAAKVADEATDIGKLSKKTSTIAKRSPIKVPKKATAQVQAKMDILKLSILGNPETISTQVGGIHAHLMHLKIKERPGLLNEKVLALAMEKMHDQKKRKF